MLTIRLQRIGKRNNPSFRVVVTDSRRGPKSADFVERVGSYNPHTKETLLNAERITHWIENGAQPSDTVHNLLINQGVIKGDKINVLPKKTPIVKDEPQEEEAPAVEEASETETEGSAEADADKPTEEEEADEPAEAEETEEAPKEEAPEASDEEEKKEA